MTPAEIAKEITQAIKDTYGEIERWAVDMEKASTKPLSSVLADGDTDTLADKPDNSNEF
jgi:hypothetical protein